MSDRRTPSPPTTRSRSARLNSRPRTEAATNVCLQRGSSRSMRDKITFSIVGGISIVASPTNRHPSSCLDERSAIDQRLDLLLHEERVAIGRGDQRLLDDIGERVLADECVQEDASASARKRRGQTRTRSAQLSRCPRTSSAETCPISSRRVATRRIGTASVSAEQRLCERNRRRVRPVQILEHHDCWVSRPRASRAATELRQTSVAADQTGRVSGRQSAAPVTRAPTSGRRNSSVSPASCGSLARATERASALRSADASRSSPSHSSSMSA